MESDGSHDFDSTIHWHDHHCDHSLMEIGTGRCGLDTNNHVRRKWKLGPVQGMGDLCGGGVKIISLNPTYRSHILPPAHTYPRH